MGFCFAFGVGGVGVLGSIYPCLVADEFGGGVGGRGGRKEFGVFVGRGLRLVTLSLVLAMGEDGLPVIVLRDEGR